MASERYPVRALGMHPNRVDRRCLLLACTCMETLPTLICVRLFVALWSLSQNLHLTSGWTPPDELQRVSHMPVIMLVAAVHIIPATFPRSLAPCFSPLPNPAMCGMGCYDYPNLQPRIHSHLRYALHSPNMTFGNLLTGCQRLTPGINSPQQQTRTALYVPLNIASSKS
jgi:hypothetical protein